MRSFLGIATERCEYVRVHSAEHVPFGVDDYDSMSLGIARAVASRYNEMTARRIAELRRLMNATPGFRSWRPDFSDASIVRIDKWILKCWALEVQPEPMRWRIVNDTKLVRKVHRILSTRREPVFDFADREVAYSACVDIACYLGALFMRKYPRLKWMAAEGGVTNRDYGMPVLAYKPNDYFLVAPVQVPILARRIIKNQSCHEGMQHLARFVWQELRHAKPPPRKKRGRAGPCRGTAEG